MVVHNWFPNKPKIIQVQLCVSSALLFAGWLHLQPKFVSLSWFKNNESRLNHHLSGLFGVGFISLDWSPCSRSNSASRSVHVGWDNFLTTPPHPAGLAPFYSGNWTAYAENQDSVSHVYGTSEGAGTAILTFLGGFHPQSINHT
jgi:photosystem I P700 chlorophyll a apoprotein A2